MRGMKVFFDIITNHTADVISYEEGQFNYRIKPTIPTGMQMAMCSMTAITLARTPSPLDAAVSFPYTPFSWSLPMRQ
jgi:hypothetical protein